MAGRTKKEQAQSYLKLSQYHNFFRVLLTDIPAALPACLKVFHQLIRSEMGKLKDTGVIPVARQRMSLRGLRDFDWDIFIGQARDALPISTALLESRFPSEKIFGRQKTMGPRRRRRCVFQ